MNLLAPDLYRNFTLGFAIGAIMVAAATIGEWGEHLESPARAAQPIEAPHADGEFFIAPLEQAE